jgi:parvulin-like peptidyl-prolyl isomerase
MKIALRLASFALPIVTLAACDGLKEAFTAHVDVAARAGSQELSVDRLATLLGESSLQIPVTRENAEVLADLWMNYQLAALAAARNDSLLSDEIFNEATTGIIAGMAVQRFMDSVSGTWQADTASEAAYNQASGGLYAARHILFGTNPTMTGGERDSVRRLAESVRGQLTSANFPQMVSRYSAEPQAGERGGSLGVFRRGEMVPEFEQAVSALRPGEISGVVETQFGYHLVQRLAYADARQQFEAAYGSASMQAAESLFVQGILDRAKVQVRDGAPRLVKDALQNPSQHRRSDTPVARFEGGPLTIGRLLTWVHSIPQSQQLRQQVLAASDSDVVHFVNAVARQELIHREAQRAGVAPTAEERAQLREQWRQIVVGTWAQLGVAPGALADTSVGQAERERLAAAKVDQLISAMVNGEVQPVPVPPQLALTLQEKYQAKINPAGVERAFERAGKVRVVADSARSAARPQSQVPLPGEPGEGAGAPPGGAPGQPPAHP